MVDSSIQSAMVYVGIVTYNSIHDLPRCFEGLTNQTYPYITTAVFDNASQDGSADWIMTHAPSVTLICNDENIGFARAHNRLLRSCGLTRHDYYLPLNPDVELLPEYISRLVTMLQQMKGGWGMGKLLLPLESTAIQRIYSVGHALRRDGYAVNIGYGLPDSERFSQPREIFGASGAASIMSQPLIDSIAPDGMLFDEDMFMYGEDTDLDWRARLQGWQCWVIPQAVAYHRGSDSAPILRAEAIANRYLSVIKNAYLVDLLTYNLPIIVLHCLLRLILTPKRGIYMILKLLRSAPRPGSKRRRAKISRQAMLQWFEWSKIQPSSQPTSWNQRFLSFITIHHW